MSSLQKEDLKVQQAEHLHWMSELSRIESFAAGFLDLPCLNQKGH